MLYAVIPPTGTSHVTAHSSAHTQLAQIENVDE